MPKERQYTDKMKAFVQAYRLSRNGTQSAIAAGYSPAQAQQIGSRLIRHPKVLEALQAAAPEATEAIVRKRLADFAPTAMQELINMAKDTTVQPAIRYACLKDLLDRAGYKPENKIQVEAVSKLESELGAFAEPPKQAQLPGHDVIDVEVLSDHDT